MPLSLEQGKIDSLISLLEDDDEQTYGLIRSQMLEMGKDLMPHLLKAEGESDSELLNSRLTSIYDQLKLDKTIDDLRYWRQNNYKNIFQAFIILSQFQYPRIDTTTISGLINKIRQDFWLEVNDNHTALEKVKVLNRIFFDIYNFEGNVDDYYAPQNSFLNDVLLLKKGNPLTLSVLYSIIAQSLDLPIYGVNTPRNFMLVYLDKMYSFPTDEVQDKNILFYINPYSKGEVHSLKDIFNYLKRVGQGEKTEFYLPCSNSTIVSRAINNIMVAYNKLGDEKAVNEYKKLLEVFH